MGRRPNVLITEFFERGAKLDDSSNRYEHTCRRCGELFPKGRLDNLRSHVVKRCPNITQEDRNSIILHMQAPAKPDSVDVTTQALEAPASLERQQSALDTLAEVSRRHLDYSSQREAGFDQHVLLQDEALAEQALWQQLRQHNMSMLAAQTNDYDLQGLDQAFTTGEFTPSIQQSDMANLTSIDPQLGVSQPFDAIDLLTTDDMSRSDNLRWTQMSNAVPQEPSNTQGRMKGRGRFTESRRKQVQEIRKRGACMRCRMLKKPCSEGTPCKTCANVDTARLWKGRCLRTRLVDEFTTWSSGYFEALSKSQTDKITSAPFSRRLPEVMHIRLTVDKGPGIVLNAKLFEMPFHRPIMDTSLPDAGLIEPTLILEDNDDLPDRLAAYCMSANVLRAAVDAEVHHFMRTTLHQAIELIVQPTEPNGTKTETRSCYSIQNSLTQDAVELWVLSACLTSSLSFVVSAGSVDRVIKPEQHNDMHGQLLAAIEVRASRLSKKVFNDMERRLLQRQQVSGFATFIASVVLVSSIERMTGLYQSLDVDDNTSWPIDVAPSSFWTQGSSFTVLLTMLLQMRGLPPNTYEDEYGNLAVALEPSQKLTQLNGSASESQLRALDEERRTALSAWLTNCNISAAEVKSWTNENSPYWHGKFIAALLMQ